MNLFIEFIKSFRSFQMKDRSHVAFRLIGYHRLQHARIEWAAIIRGWTLAFCILLPELLSSQCSGLDADAGPDQIICDPSQLIQLQGNIQGTYSGFKWTPSNNLSSVDVLDPLVTTRIPGKYTFKLTAEGVSTTNLITNGNFESGNSGFTSNYTYNFVNTTEGEYFVTPNPSSWNGGFSPCGDHTSGGGNMLLLNGHPVAGTNFWCQTIPTVAGRMYLFEFWHTSVVSSNPGQLSVKINGNTVGATVAGSLCNWERYEVCFTATSGSTQICLNEGSGIRGGNDFAVDDLALFEKCSDMDEVMVEIIDLKAKIDILKKPKCSSEPFDLTGLGSSFGPNIRYEWSTIGGRIISQNGLQARARGSGIYILKVIYSNGSTTCEQEASIEFEAPDELIGTVIPEKRLNCNKDSLIIKVEMASGSGDYSYLWSPDSALLSGQNTESVWVNQARRYMVTVTDNISGCVLVMDVDVVADTLKPDVRITGDSILNCKTNSVKLSATTRDSMRTRLLWTTPDQTGIPNQKNISSNQTGIFRLVLQDTINLCTDTAFWTVKLDTLSPILELGPDRIIDCQNDTVSVSNLLAELPGSYQYLWEVNGISLPIESTLMPKDFSSGTKIRLRIIRNENGCEVLDSLLISDLRMIPPVEAGQDSLLNCLNTQIRLQASFDPADSLSFIWTTAGGNIVSGNDRPDPLVNQKGWYYLKVRHPKTGCENQDSLFIDEDKALPLVIPGADQTFACKDSILTIDASASSSGAFHQYLWSTSNGLILSGQGSPTIRAGAPGVYWLTVVNTQNGCRDSASVRLNPDLNKPSISILAPDTLTCKLTRLALTAQATSSSGNKLDILWTAPAGASLSEPMSLNPEVTAPGRYILLVTDATNGCSSLASVNVEIDTLRPISNAGTDEIWNCASKQIQLMGQVNGNPSTFLYRWSTSGGQIQGNSNLQTIQAVAPGDYILQVENLRNGCISNDTMRIQPDLKVPDLSIAPADTLNCLRNQVILFSMAQGQSGSISYNWATANGNISGPSNTPSLTVDKTGLYTLTVTDDQNFCTRVASVTVVEDKQKPDIRISPPTQLNCSVKTVQLLASVQNAGARFIAQWYTQNGSLKGTTDSLSAEAEQSGRYYLRIINTQNGCESTDSIEVSENTNLPVDVRLDLIQPRCTGDEASVSVLQVIGGAGPYLYFVDNQSISGNYLSGLSPGWHQLRVVDANGCILIRDFEVTSPSATGVSMPPNVKINEGDALTLMPVFSIPDDSIAWIKWTPTDHLSCSDCAQPEVIGLQKETLYTITYANRQGCIASASILIEIIRRGVWVPNAFSPNGDGVNDGFYPVVSEDSYRTVRSMSVYDRWGALVFQKSDFPPNDPAEGWDGRFRGEPLNPGVYVYLIELEWKNGERQNLQGDFTLVR